jgi:hypothetical protein
MMENEELQYTGFEARQFASRGQLEEWVHLYLNTAGKNPKFSEGLKKQTRHWVGPILVDADLLKRCHGPDGEPNMEYYSTVEHWDYLVGQYEQMFRDGWDFPPLILHHINGELSVRDGNRRTAALKRAGMKQFWVIIWDDENVENIWNTLRK